MKRALLWLVSGGRPLDALCSVYLVWLVNCHTTAPERLVVHHAADEACHFVTLALVGPESEPICAPLVELSDLLTLLLAAQQKNEPATFSLVPVGGGGGATRPVTIAVGDLPRAIDALVATGATPSKKK